MQPTIPTSMRSSRMTSYHALPKKQSTQPVTPTYRALDLTEGGDLAQIALHDQVYTLRITRAGKLILTK